MTERERFIKALRREPIEGHVPTFELVFFLTMEKFGKMHPHHRSFHQWDQMSAKERELHLQDIAQVYIDYCRTYHHSAMLVQRTPNRIDAFIRLLEIIREKSGDEFCVLAQNDPTLAMPDGDHMMDFSVRMYEDMQSLKDEQKRRIDWGYNLANELATHHKGLVDGWCECSDYCFNVNPFYTPDIFAELIAPGLKETIDGWHELGFYAIKHTDGNINPIVDQMVACGPDALHSLDPQGGVDLGEIKKKYGDKVCLIGNVNCGLLQTGTIEECEADVRRALKQGMEGWGYVFATSNCVYTGLDLERYERMNKIWWEEGIYPKDHK